MRIRPGWVSRELWVLGALLFSLTQQVGAEVRSQFGTVTFNPGQNRLVYPVNPVKAGKSLLLYSLKFNRFNLSPNDYMAMGRLDGVGNVTFTREGTGGSLEMNWQLLEFTGRVQVQRGITQLKSRRMEISISAVDLSRAFVVVHMQSQADGFGAAAGITARLDASDKLVLQTRADDYDDITAAWQVVEYGGCQVIPYSIELQSDELTRSVDLGPKLTPLNTFVVGSHLMEPAGSNEDGEISYAELPRTIVQPGSLKLVREATGSRLVQSGYAIVFTDGSTVNQTTLDFQTGVSELSWSASLHPDRSVIGATGNFLWQGSGHMPGVIGDHLIAQPGPVWFDFSRAEKGISISRSGSSGPAVLPLQLLHLAEHPKFLSHPQDMSVEAGDSIEFSVTYSPSSNVQVRWLQDGVPIPGADSANLILGPIAQQADSSHFQCILDNGTDTAISTQALLRVRPVVVAKPLLVAGDTTFRDSTVVMLKSGDHDLIYYTVNGRALPEEGLLFDKPLVLHETVLLEALAVRKGVSSPKVAWNFNRQREIVPPPLAQLPNALPGSKAFFDSVSVALSHPKQGAKIHFSIDGSMPDTLSPLYATPLVLRSSTTLRFLAVVTGYRPSAVVEEVYHKTTRGQVDKPVSNPAGGEFFDSIPVTLRVSTQQAKIHYTLDGTLPDTTSAVYSGPISLDSSTILTALAVAPDYLRSDTVVAIFRKRPHRPQLVPGPGLYTAPVDVKISAQGATDSIRYTLDGSQPTALNGQLYNSPLRLMDSAVVKAIAFLSDVVSDVASAEYFVTTGQGEVDSSFLAPGDSISLPGMVLHNTSLQAGLGAVFSTVPQVHVKNFLELGQAFQVLRSSDATIGFPALELHIDTNGRSHLGFYSLSPSGFPAFYSPMMPVIAISEPGIFFFGEDYQVPTLDMLDQTPDSLGTRLRFLVTDNILNPSYSLTCFDGVNTDVTQKLLIGDTLVISLKNPGLGVPLEIHLQVTDYRNQSHFPPAATARFTVRQYFEEVEVQLVRSGKVPPWSLMGFPVTPGEGPRLKTGTGAASAPIKAMKWVHENLAQAGDGKYSEVTSLTDLLPGEALWYRIPFPANANAVPELTLRKAHSNSSDENGDFKVTLRKGWNQISNPSLRPLYWPVAADAGFVPTAFKRLRAYNYSEGPMENSWPATDSLAPWEGYFVWYHSETDTTITLLANPPGAGLSKPGSLPRDKENILLRASAPGSLPSLVLGAMAKGSDAFAWEDEPMPPSVEGHGGMWLDLSGSRMVTDIRRYSPGRVQIWTIISSGQGSASESGELELEGLELPQGYVAMASSSRLGLQGILHKGSKIPLTTGISDTLRIRVGPAGMLGEGTRWGHDDIPHDAALHLISRNGRMLIRLDLPQQAQVRLAAYDSRGRLLKATGQLGLPAGRLHLRSEDLLPGLPSGPAPILLRINALSGSWRWDQTRLWHRP